MPVIPEFTNPTSTATAPLPRMDVRAAGAVADAIARGGAQLEATVEPWAQRYADARRGVMASDAMVTAQDQLGASALNWSRTAGTLDQNGQIIGTDQARNGFANEAQQLRTQTLAQVADPLVKEQVASQFDHALITHADTVLRGGFAQESAAQQGKLDLQLDGMARSAALAPSPEAKQQAIATAQQAIGTLRDAGFMDGETAAQKGIAFSSRIQEVAAEQEMNRLRDIGSRDPDAAMQLARKINDPASYPGLLPEARERLGRQADSMTYTFTTQAAARQQRSDAIEERDLHKTQAANEIEWLDQVYKFQKGQGPAVDLGALSDAGKRGDLSTQGFAAVHAALGQAEQGRDDPLVKNDLLRRIGDGEDVHADIRQAIISHQLSDASQSELMRANYARQGKGDNAVARATFQQLKTALGGHAIDSGFLDITKEGIKDQAALWAQAQGEWNRRVLVGSEDPNVVYADMVPRYRHATLSPQSMPTPRLGALQSTGDVATVWAQTKAALAGGQITQDQYDDEARLLDGYRRFYADQAARLAAAPPRAGAGGKPHPGADQ